ncbi:transcriptional regulator, TetR family [Xylanimonas cellulosilytica DSM 15894]|uniref:Transcriptional regulator, TetR family n=1 Tax=Xylanimonas cellulosilytica (strain DSM 15894 / JCM 12276 / CECT 5975 / KCTC 9989 / LMG 20990 / NBRC 107835 / XIL07) TaxID=446471 RepID=D1BU20_XYLCX|nr:TetR family transcriptional regulator [Xylanimonas cellulosilytica]ACZ29184.1 transcriptional regulator, TetR family [Xylanimonas cellulosilytica DSM 15894]
MRSVEELSTRSRIRDAAVSRFARDGFRVPLRVIAADAGVSPALVIHHFGSKDGLRAACDEHVLEHSLMLKSGVVENTDPALLRSLLGNLRVFDEPVAYLLRALLDGGEAARSILERTVAAVETYLEAGVASGVIRPSRDPAGRARYLTYMSLGLLVTAFLAGPRTDGDDDDGAASDEGDPYGHVTELLASLTLPHLEVMTHGLIADPELLHTAEDWAATATPTTPNRRTRRDP